MDSDSESLPSQEHDQDEQGWEDVEEDKEEIQVISLFDDRSFPNVTGMLRDCKERYDFDIWQVRRALGLDFLDLIKLCNYIRTCVKSGNLKPDVSSKSLFEDENFLKPVLEDDALLYSLDDAFDSEPSSAQNPLQAEVESLREQLSHLKSQFTAYRTDVQRSLLENLNLDSTELAVDASAPSSSPSASRPHYLRDTRKFTKAETEYFSSYAHPAIHHTMLADTIRTNAYRDFIYDNKHLFHNATVLDVGCGTGILSMFCAKAGAMVIAVDNSAVVDKARENVFKNGLDKQVKVLRGKIEEVTLPVDKVDIIVSEWMGYCLLYESMLDSVIYARARYLKEDGLMVPSHATLKIAPLVDSETRIEHIDFWREVYGFDMSGMLEHAYDEVLIPNVNKEDVMSEGVVFKELDLHTVKVEDLSFSAPFELEWKAGSKRLEGFVIWFDMFFATSRKNEVSVDALSKKNPHEDGAKAFSTGPHNPPTHWSQGVLLLKDVQEGITPGEKIEGLVKYMKAGDGERSLDIEVEWRIDGKGKGKGKKGKQRWKLE